MRKGVIHLLMLGLVVALALPAIACQQEEPAEIEMEIETPPGDTMEEMGDDMEEMGDDMEDAAEEVEEGVEEMTEDEPPPPAS